MLHASHRDLDRATKEAADLLKRNIKALDSTAEKVTTEAGADNLPATALTKYCRYMCTGLLYWA